MIEIYSYGSFAACVNDHAIARSAFCSNGLIEDHVVFKIVRRKPDAVFAGPGLSGGPDDDSMVRWRRGVETPMSDFLMLLLETLPRLEFLETTIADQLVSMGFVLGDG